MNKKLVKHAVSFLLLLVLMAPALVMAQNSDVYMNTAGAVNLPGKTSAIAPITVITNIINIFLGLLGLLAVIIILIGGFKWMTANGVEDKVKTAKKTIYYGLIGLVIILLAYVIVKVVIGAVVNFGNNPNAAGLQ
jgi:hypothetical protein